MAQTVYRQKPITPALSFASPLRPVILRPNRCTVRFLSLLLLCSPSPDGWWGATPPFQVVWLFPRGGLGWCMSSCNLTLLYFTSLYLSCQRQMFRSGPLEGGLQRSITSCWSTYAIYLVNKFEQFLYISTCVLRRCVAWRFVDLMLITYT